jgi:PiT family inorganic phosphate transporter
MIFIFLSSGLFLGWSLGANDAANIFGTAVGTRMLRFKTAAAICAVFVVIGAVLGGAGTTDTLGQLGSVNALAGAFMVALAAGFTVYWMTRLRIPVSTSQAIVGAIIGWNIFSGSLTDYETLSEIVVSWFLAPVIAALVSGLLFLFFRYTFTLIKIHLIRLDYYMRIGLILTGAFGAYSLGANNIANVIGVFVPISPFSNLKVLNLFTLTGAEQLFLLGGLAIAVGAYTYSKKVMETVGQNILKLSPQAALVVVLAQAFVLFIFSSSAIEGWLIKNNLPALPLVPISSSHAVVGAVIGIGLVKKARGIRYKVLGGIASGWFTTPLIAGVITFVSLFFLQNVFGLEVSKKITYRINEDVRQELILNDVPEEEINQIIGERYQDALKFQDALEENTDLTPKQQNIVFEYAEETYIRVNETFLSAHFKQSGLSETQYNSLNQLSGQVFTYRWQFIRALQNESDGWKLRPANRSNRRYNQKIQSKINYLVNLLSEQE